MKKYDLKMMENHLLRRLFSIKENESSNGEVVALIKNDVYTSNPVEFYKSFKRAKHPKMLTPYTLDELKEMKTFKLKGYNIGFALKKFQNKGYSEIVAVHNAEPEVKGIGAVLMDSAIRLGGRYLDHFDGFLSGLYSKAGFKEYKREPYNSDYDPNGVFKDQYGEADIIYRHYYKVPSPE